MFDKSFRKIFYAGGVIFGKMNVGVNIGNWETNAQGDSLITFKNASPGTASKVRYRYAMSDTYWRPNNPNIGYKALTVFRSLADAPETQDHNFEIEIDATSRYNAGWSAARQHSGVLVFTGHSYNSSTGVHTYTYRQDINSANPIVGSGSRTVYW